MIQNSDADECLEVFRRAEQLVHANSLLGTLSILQDRITADLTPRAQSGSDRPKAICGRILSVCASAAVSDRYSGGHRKLCAAVAETLPSDLSG
jgi:hypothetical protein